MTPKPPPSVIPAPPNFAVPEFSFPNAIPGRDPPHSDFQLWAEVTPQAFPVTPPIPPTVQTGDVITASHENTVSTAINDLWIDLQSLGASAISDPTSATGDLIVREGGVLSRLPAGAIGTLLMADSGQSKGLRWATVSSTGAVPSSRQVLAGTGMTGGGPLTADVTLNAKVTSVNTQIGAVVLTAADISGAVPNTRTITPADATLIVTPSGGTLSANLTFQVAPDTSIQKIRYSKDGALVGTRREVNLIPGANVTISVTDDAPNNRINVNVAAAGGGSGGMVDPTANPGDLIVRGTSTTTNLPVGTVGQVLTVDTSLGVKMKWAAQATGVAPTRRVDTTAPALTGGGDLTADLILMVNPDTIVQKTRTSYNGTLVGTRRETNFVAGSNVSLLVADDAANNRVNVTISSTAVGGAQSPWTSDINAAGFTLFSAGKVGIGIATPQAPLHVVSASVTVGMIETTAASGGLALLNLKTATSFWQVAAGGAASALPGCWWVYDQAGAGTRLVISPSGNVGVGVGTNVPNSLFQVGQGTPLAAGIADFYGPNRTQSQSALVNIYSTDAMAADKGGSLGLGGPGGSPNPFAFAYLAGRSEGNAYAGYFSICTLNAGGSILERMRVTSTGLVGIGRTPTAYAFEVQGDVSISGTLRNVIAIGIATTTPLAKLDVVAGSMSMVNANAGAGAVRISTDTWSSAPSMLLGVDGAVPASWIQAIQAGATHNPLLLQPNGNCVGIGMTGAPVERLELVGNIGMHGAGGNPSYYRFAPYTDQTYLQIGYFVGGAWYGNGGILLSYTGNVGIGKTPGFALDVAGDVNATGSVRVNGTAVIQWASGVAASGSTTLGAQADIPGLTVTVPYTGRYLVLATCQILNSGDTGNLARIFMVAGGAQSPYVGDYGSGANAGNQITLTFSWHTILGAGGIIKIQGARVSGSSCVVTSLSTLLVQWVSAG